MRLAMLHSSLVQQMPLSLSWQQIKYGFTGKMQPEIWLCNLESAELAVSGNKVLKLRAVVQHILQQQKAGIFTFGGAFSNHLAAVASLCHQYGFKSVGYVRTDRLDFDNPTLRYCQERGMTLIALDRHSYRMRNQADFIDHLQSKHDDLLMVPEGGSSALGAAGFADIDFADTPAGPAELVCCASASGGTLAGLIANDVMPADTSILGITVVKDSSLTSRVEALLPENSRLRPWQLCSSYTAAGYARFNEEAVNFCRDMARQHIYVEPIYTGKALAGLIDLVNNNDLPAKIQRISFFHTGGLQGLAGLAYRQRITATDLALLSGSAAG